jgi:hypothetical protein
MILTMPVIMEMVAVGNSFYNLHEQQQQIQRSGFNSLHYQIFWEVVGLEWGPLSLVSTNEELLERKSSDSSL